MNNEASDLVMTLTALWESPICEKSKIGCSLLEKFRENDLLPWGLLTKIISSPLDSRHFLFIELLNTIPIESFRRIQETCYDLNLFMQNKKEIYNFILKCIEGSKNSKIITEFQDNFQNLFDIYRGAWDLFLKNYSKAEKRLQLWLYQNSHQFSFFPIVYLLLASIYRIQPALNRAIECLNQALKILPDNEVLLCRLGQIYGELKQYSEAENYFSQSILSNPSSVEVLLQRSWIALQKRDFSIAEEFQSKALNLEPFNPDIFCSIGDRFSLQDANKEAIPYYERAIELNPYNLQYYKNIGVTYLELKDFAMAEKVLQQIPKLDPERSEGWFALGWLNQDQGNYKTAIDYFQRALSIEPNNIEILQDLSDCYEKLDDRKKAIFYLKKALSIAPKNADILWRLANFHLDEDKSDIALDLLEKCLQNDPNHIQGLNTLAYYYDELQDNFPRAKELYLHALDYDSTQYTKTNLAQAYYNREMFDEAEKILEPLIDTANDFRLPYYLGLIKRDYRKRYEESAQLFQRALQIEKDNVLVTMDLIDLYLSQLNQPSLAEYLMHSLEAQEKDDPFLKMFLDKARVDLAGRKK